MANITVYDPVTRASKTISITVQNQIIQQDGDGQQDFFLVLSTSALKVGGDAIPDHSIRTLGDLARDTTQHDGVTVDDYASITAAVHDHVINMVEGDGGDDAMDFS
jgi:hypothetical protein